MDKSVLPALKVILPGHCHTDVNGKIEIHT